jgi:hypothetical protein
MENLLNGIQTIEKEHPEFFEKHQIKLQSYFNISKRPVMLRFNKELDSKQRLPEDIYNKVDLFIKSYYGI